MGRAPRQPQAGDQLSQFSGTKLVWELEEVVVREKKLLVDPIRHAAREVDPYAESLRKIEGEFVPESVAPRSGQYSDIDH